MKPLTKKSADPRFLRAFRKALKDYGSRAQAERIAWAVVDQIGSLRRSKAPSKRRSGTRKAS